MNFSKQIFIVVLIILTFGCNSKSKNFDKTSKPNQDAKVFEKKELNQAPKKENDKFTLTDDNVIDFLFEYEKNNKENHVRIHTTFGNIDILLYANTPYHRSNFIYLTKKKYFDGTQFYRVINNFIIQGGNSDDKKTANKRAAIGRYLLPTDTNRGFTHERGVISMPSGEIDNPYKLASPFEFFIIQQDRGSHFLDGDYTVFGKVISGMDVVDKIAAVKTDEADWPLHNVYIRKAEIIN